MIGQCWIVEKTKTMGNRVVKSYILSLNIFEAQRGSVYVFIHSYHSCYASVAHFSGMKKSSR